MRPAILTLRHGALAVAGLVLGGCGPSYPPERDLLLATATTGGTYYPVGVAIATMVTRELGVSHTVNLSAITSSGSAENISLLANDEVQLALIQALFGSMAWQGTGLYEGRPVRNLRSLTLLWENVEQIVAYSQFCPSGTVADLDLLKGRRFSIGSQWSGTEISASTILRMLGYDPAEDFDLAHLGYGASADALQNRKLSAMFLAGGVPTGAITRALASAGQGNLTLLEFESEHLTRIRAAYPVWNRFVIPAGTYPGQERDIATVSQPNLLVATAGADEEVIHLIVKTIYDRLDYLQELHAATRAMSLETAVHGLPVPLHPGAVRFYREKGLDIPAELVPPEMRGRISILGKAGRVGRTTSPSEPPLSSPRL